MLIDWTGEFDRWYDRLIGRAEAGEQWAVEQVALVDAELGVLQDLVAEPQVNTPTLRRVSQSRKYDVWRVAHPFVDGTAMRLIVWFPPDRPGKAVIVLFGATRRRWATCSTTASAPVPMRRSRVTCTEPETRERPMSEQTTFVGTKKAADKMARARAIPGVAVRSAQVRAVMDEADRVHAGSLAAIRKAADLTQVALAAQMGVPQTVVSRLERQHDMLLSTLNGYLLAAGEHPRVVVTINGHDIELDLATLAAR